MEYTKQKNGLRSKSDLWQSMEDSSNTFDLETRTHH